MTMNEKRKHFRKSATAEAAIADITGNTWIAVDFLDISRNGVAFISPDEQTTGSSRMLRFLLPGSEKRIAVICRIVYASPHIFLAGYRIGAEFVRIDEVDWQTIEAFINIATEIEP